MRLMAVIGILAMVLTLALAGGALATNGDNLIGVGTASRAMGGVGIAAPQDAVTATFSNPAAMSFVDFDPASQAGTSMTLFMPKVRAEFERADGTYAGDSAEKIYMIPSAAVSIPLSEGSPHWRFGFGAYGVSGMGVNYRDVDVDDTDGFGYPVAAGTYTELSRMKVSPALSVRPLDWLAVGLGLQLHYASLDLDEGAKTGLALGLQAGILVKPTDSLSLGLTYVSSQEVEHKDVADFDGDGSMDTLDLASPQMFGLGLAWESPESDFLVEADFKWYNWSEATGYKDFDWEDQWVLALGAQYRPVDNLALRIGYNYAENPVDDHDDFTGTDPIEVQGKFLPQYYYESFRIVGFPAIVEHHVSAGLAWSISDSFTLCLSYMHAFEKTITEEGTDLYGQPVTIRSKLSEDSLGLGLSYSF